MMRILRRAPALALLALAPLAAGCARGDDAAPAEGAAKVAAAPAGQAVTVTVYKSPTCGCCTKWEEHLRGNGFRVVSVPREDMNAIKAEHGVPKGLQSCHTALVDGYAVEGHVPADVIRKLLSERPKVKGVAVPGMPMGSPGMEGPHKDEYEVYTFDASGPKDVYAVR
ncbi:MAG TPA: DUF411 domain-containing protein [Longimicrobiaceae bacterium]|nr:DUF411 domain-containing protein [Longimicrobiaceae bacterium]